METGKVKIAGLTETDRVLNTMTATRIVPFPDGIDRSFTLLARYWFIFDVWQLQHGDPIMVATMAHENARQVAVELGRDTSQFEADVRYCFEDILKLAAAYVEMPGEVSSGNDNTRDL